MQKKSLETTRKHIVCIGGGTGTFVALKGLKHSPHHLSAIVAMSDSGGSNKRIRDEFGLLPTSDLRQCLVALSDENGGAGILRKLFMYRFEKGEGHQRHDLRKSVYGSALGYFRISGSRHRNTGKVLRIQGQFSRLPSPIPICLLNTKTVKY